MLQVLHEREQHTKLYERMALLEDQLRRKEQHEKELQETVLQLQEKMTLLESSALNIPTLSKRFDALEDHVMQGLQEYESKLSAMGGEVIRLKSVENQLLAKSQSLLQIKTKPTQAAASVFTKGFSLLVGEPSKTGLVPDNDTVPANTSHRLAPSTFGLMEGGDEVVVVMKTASEAEGDAQDVEDSEEDADDESKDPKVDLSINGNDIKDSGFGCPSKDPEVLTAFIGGQCLYFPKRPPTDWTSAQKHCHTVGGALATPQDIWPLRRYLDTLSGNIESLWLGGYYEASSQTWQWTGGEQTGTPVSFQDLETDTSISNLLKEEVQEGEDEDVSRNFVQEVLTQASRHRLSFRGYPSSAPDPFSSSSSSHSSVSSTMNSNIPPPSLKNLVDIGSNGNIDKDEKQQQAQDQQRQDQPLRCLLLHKNNSLHPEVTKATCNEHHHYACQLSVRRPIDITSLLTLDDAK
ncbi:uncharacterized protein LOC143034543 isoform X2 [Oratosquilla oratoria]